LNNHRSKTAVFISLLHLSPSKHHIHSLPYIMKLNLLLSLLLQTARVALAQEDLDCSFGADIFLRSDGSVIFRHVTNPVEGTLKVELVYEGEGWLGLGFSNAGIDGHMIGTDAVIGLPNDPVSVTNPAKYILASKSASGVTELSTAQQTLQDASITQNATHTVLAFTKFLAEESEVELLAAGRHNFIWAIGQGNSISSYHGRKGDFTIDLVPCRVIGAEVDTAYGDTVADAEDTPILILSGSGVAPNRQLWVAHGVLMSVAWGILIPLGIGSSRLRDLFHPEMWIKIHQTLNMTAIICTIIGFAIAVYNISDETFEGEEANHFSSTAHRTVGLVIFLLTILQAVGGLLRPHPPAQPLKEVDAESLKNTAHSRLTKDEENHVSSDEEEGDHKPTKTRLRFIWECKHRFMGTALLAMAWYNCSSGIELFSMRFGEEDDKRGAFWGVAASVVGLIIIADVFQRVRR
jgi:hypothetical protein